MKSNILFTLTIAVMVLFTFGAQAETSTTAGIIHAAKEWLSSDSSSSNLTSEEVAKIEELEDNPALKELYILRKKRQKEQQISAQEYKVKRKLIMDKYSKKILKTHGDQIDAAVAKYRERIIEELIKEGEIRNIPY